MRLLVPAALMTSSVPVANSVPRYFMCLRAVLTTACGAGPFGCTTSWLMSFLLFFACTLFTGAFVFKVAMLSDERITQLQYLFQFFSANFGEFPFYALG